MSYPLTELFHFSNLLQMPNDHRMAYVEFFGYFSCSCKRISFNDRSQLVVVNFQRLATARLIFKALVSFAKLLEPPVHCMFISSSWTKCAEVKWSHSVMSNSSQPHGLQPPRLLCPWDFPGNSTGVGCHFLLQGIFPTQGLNPGLLHCRQMLYPLSHQGSCKWSLLLYNQAIWNSNKKTARICFLSNIISTV